MSIRRLRKGMPQMFTILKITNFQNLTENVQSQKAILLKTSMRVHDGIKMTILYLRLNIQNHKYFS